MEKYVKIYVYGTIIMAIIGLISEPIAYDEEQWATFVSLMIFFLETLWVLFSLAVFGYMILNAKTTDKRIVVLPAYYAFFYVYFTFLGIFALLGGIDLTDLRNPFSATMGIVFIVWYVSLIAFSFHLLAGRTDTRQ